MIEFGKTLREAREAKGLTIAQLAEITRMPSSRITALETENFSGIPAAIYGRGFVRLYCDAVGLDSKPLAAEFTEIYSGNRDLEIKERAPAAPVAEPPAATVAESPAAPQAPEDDFKLESREIHVSAPASDEAPIPEPPPIANSILNAALAARQATANAAPSAPQATAPSPAAAPLGKPLRTDRPLSRYAAPVDERQATPRASFSLPSFSLPSISIPPAVWRIGLLAVVGILILAALCFGVRALYRTVNETDSDSLVEPAPATETTPQETKPKEEKPQETKPQKTQPQPAQPRTPQKIPALYID